MSFPDNFSRQAAEYARHRPHYPRALYEYIASLPPGRELAWDCGTGNGQAAAALADYFDRVIATDASSRQIEQAAPHDRVNYRVAPAEHTDIPHNSVDAITIAQAIHWFDHDAFYAEVRRVAKPGAIIAAWTYNASMITPEIDRILAKYWRDVVGNYWAEQIEYVMKDYRTLPFPFEEMAPPMFVMEVSWNMYGLLGYLASWSATQKFRESQGRDPIDEIREELEDAWGESEEEKVVRWKMRMRVGKVGGEGR